jgi:hypothetical protein
VTAGGIVQQQRFGIGRLQLEIRVDAADVRKRLRCATVLRFAPLLASGDLMLGEAQLLGAQELAERRKLDAVYVTGSNLARPISKRRCRSRSSRERISSAAERSTPPR